MDEKNSNGPIIETNALEKWYGGNVLAVDKIDLAIPPNTIYSLMGPNGAGKTTTVSILTTMIQPSSGSAKVTGYDVVYQADKVRRRIGVTFQEMVLDEDLTGRQTLDYHGRLYRIRTKQRQDKIAELLVLVELEDAADRRIRTYSGGMKRRLELARGLMTEPEVLFLDEPTTGLDPQNRANIWEYIKNLKQQRGLTLLLTTHYMEEAEALADQVGIIDHGKIVTEGAPNELINEMGADTVYIHGQGASEKFVSEIKLLPFVQSVHMTDGCVRLGTDSGNRRLVELISLANNSDFTIEEISVAKPSLGDVFLKYTGRQLRDV